MVVDEKSLNRHQRSPAVGQSPSISAPKRAMPPPLPSGHTGPALLPPSLAPPAGAAPATVNSFINAALVEAEAGALAMHVRRLADQVAFETCSDLNGIVAGMLQAESESQKRDAHPVTEHIRSQRRLDWLQAYRRSVLDGPGSEFSHVRPGKGGKGRGAAGRGRGAPPSSSS